MRINLTPILPTQKTSLTKNNKQKISIRQKTPPTFQGITVHLAISRADLSAELVKKHCHLKPIIDKLIATDLSNNIVENLISAFPHQSLNVVTERIQRLLDFRERAIENKDTLARADETIDIEDIDKLFFSSPYMTYHALDLVGEDTLIYSFKDKYDNVKDYLNDFGLPPLNEYLRQRVKELLSPKESLQYSIYEEQIKKLKKTYQEIPPLSETEYLKNAINTITKAKNDLFAKAAKDNKNKLEVALIASFLQDDYQDALDVLENADFRTKDSIQEFYNNLEKFILKKFGIKEISENIKTRIDFKNNKFLPRLLKSKGDFRKNFKELVLLLNEYPNKSTKEVLDNLPQNIKTKNMLQSVGVNYDKWCEFNPNSFLEFKIGNNTVRIQKIDMNNIIKALFIGDESSCCTKMGGKENAAAVTYIKNKMFTGIEVLYNGEPIGNTMCYIAEIDETPSLILDNIELLPQYRELLTFDSTRHTHNNNHKKIRDGIFNYAQQMLRDIDCPNMPLFLNGVRQKVSVTNLKKNLYKMDVIGNSGNDCVYIDNRTSAFVINENSRHLSYCGLYPINEQARLK